MAGAIHGLLGEGICIEPRSEVNKKIELKPYTNPTLCSTEFDPKSTPYLVQLLPLKNHTTGISPVQAFKTLPFVVLTVAKIGPYPS